LGSSLRAWVDADRITDVSAVYESSGLDRTMPQALLDAATYRVKAWGVPTGSHRGNVLWFNQRMLRDAGVAVPGPGYTIEAFEADLAKVAESGKTALCLGGKDRFTATELFENTLLGIIGPTGWTGIRDDSFDWRGSQLRQALSQFAQIVSRADPNAGGLTWDQAAKKLATGQCAFLSMNDSVYGELVANRSVEGKDFGYVPFPGTKGAYLAIVDTFVVSAQATDGVNAMKFMGTIADPKTSLEFNKLKGSVPIRNDVDVSSLPAYQRQASESLWKDKILLSITHGELMSTDFQHGVYDAVAAFVQSKNTDAFIDTLQNSIEVPIARR
jgi:glucose/mannose transport system substrate-binding protein